MVLEEQGAGPERVRTSKGSRSTLFLLKPPGCPHRASRYCIQSAEDPVTGQGSTQSGTIWLWGLCRPHPQSHRAKPPLIALRGRGARRFPSFSEGHSLS